jgi:hypothetical protein
MLGKATWLKTNTINLIHHELRQNLGHEKAAERLGIIPLQLQRQHYDTALCLPESDPKKSRDGQASMVIDELADNTYLDICMK